MSFPGLLRGWMEVWKDFPWYQGHMWRWKHTSWSSGKLCGNPLSLPLPPAPFLEPERWQVLKAQGLEAFIPSILSCLSYPQPWLLGPSQRKKSPHFHFHVKAKWQCPMLSKTTLLSQAAPPRLPVFSESHILRPLLHLPKWPREITNQSFHVYVRLLSLPKKKI